MNRRHTCAWSKYNKRERVEERRRERRERKMKIWEEERRDVPVYFDFRDSGLLI